jgi:hypothetical protein
MLLALAAEALNKTPSAIKKESPNRIPIVRSIPVILA